MTITREPIVRDEVKHVREDITGVVLAKYPGTKLMLKPLAKPIDPTKNYLDVQIDRDHVYYNTLAENWVVTRAVEDIE